MKFSESWLREWINPQLETQALTHQITMAGLEVDDCISVAGQFHGVVVGEVVECAQHPDADKLRVTKVNVGAGELLDIVCGAPNCRQGLKVAVAMVGAELPGNFKIKQAKLRGQPSCGMLCSFAELGIDVDSSGIIELAQDAPLGVDIRDYLALNDVSIDVDLTANRADCLSIRGLAREVGVLNCQDLTPVAINAVAPSIDAKLAIEINSPQGCPRYIGRVIRGINLKAITPLWMQEKLRRSGIRSIDPVVDVTNYVMLEQGQPMHAFDLNKIDQGIVVRMAKAGETLVLLDGNEVTLDDSTLVIADKSKPLALAGIFGGKASGVSTDTQDILLESAFFSPHVIRGRARRYGLHTDSSHRYERGVDPELQQQAIERATELLIAICGGQAGALLEVCSAEHLPTREVIELRRAKLDGLLGHHISGDKVADILSRLGCDVVTNGEDWKITPPSWRFDMAIEQDLIEEVGRIYGYDNIPMQAPVASLTMNSHRESDLSLNAVRNFLVARGFYEAITYSFVEPSAQQLIVPDVAPLILPNPISAEMSAMRLSLWTGLLNTVAYNQKRQQPRVRLFEAGLRFIPDQNAENGMRQEMMLAGVITGTRNQEHWQLSTESVDFYDIKGDVEALLALTGNQNYRFEAINHPALHPGQSAALLLNGKVVGHLGALHPELERKFGLNGRTFVFEVEWQALKTKVIPTAQAISKYPANRRDIAVIVDENVQANDVVAACLAANSALVTDAFLFDLYQGQGVEQNKKSLAIALTLQSSEKTLEESDISQAVSVVIEQLTLQFNAQLRD